MKFIFVAQFLIKHSGMFENKSKYTDEENKWMQKHENSEKLYWIRTILFTSDVDPLVRSTNLWVALKLYVYFYLVR